MYYLYFTVLLALAIQQFLYSIQQTLCLFLELSLMGAGLIIWIRRDGVDDDIHVVGCSVIMVSHVILLIRQARHNSSG